MMRTRARKRYGIHRLLLEIEKHGNLDVDCLNTILNCFFENTNASQAPFMDTVFFLDS